MREVKISLTGWTLADAMGELRKWLDHHNCVPVNFAIERGKRRVLDVRTLLADDTMADMFQRDAEGRCAVSSSSLVTERSHLAVNYPRTGDRRTSASKYEA